jgi:hypothetical protein
MPDWRRQAMIDEAMRADAARKGAPAPSTTPPATATTFVPDEAPAAPAATPSAVVEHSLAGAVTGRPIRVRLMRGQGSTDSPYNPLGAQVPILGSGRYTTPSREYAEHFGPNVTEHDVTLRNPLVITNDVEWRALTQRAGWRFPNPFGLPPAKVEADIARLRAMLEQDGYDGVVVRINPVGDYGKTLYDVFGDDQVVEFRPVGDAPAPAVPKVFDDYAPTEIPGVVASPAPPRAPVVERTPIDQMTGQQIDNVLARARQRGTPMQEPVDAVKRFLAEESGALNMQPLANVGEAAAAYLKDKAGTQREQIGPELYETLQDARVAAGYAAIEGYIKNRGEIFTPGLIQTIVRRSRGHLTPFQAAKLGEFLRKLPVIGSKFGLSDASLRRIGKVAEGIRGWNVNGPIFGTLERTPKTRPAAARVIPPTTVAPGSAGYGPTTQMVGPDQVRQTPSEARALYDQLSLREKIVLRRYALDFELAAKEGIGDFNRNVQKFQFNIQSDIEGYLRRIGFDRQTFRSALMNTFRGFTTSRVVYGSRKFRSGAEGYEYDLGKATLDAMVGLRLEQVKNTWARQFEETILSNPETAIALHPLQKIPDGYSEYFGKYGRWERRRFAVPTRIANAFIRFFDPRRPGPTHEGARKLGRVLEKGGANVVGYWTQNTLFAAQTVMTNMFSNSIQYAAHVIETGNRALVEAATGNMREAGRYAARAGRLAVVRPIQALTPTARLAIPPHELGQNMGNILQDAGANIPILQPLYDAFFAVYGAVENWPKRAIELEERAAAAAARNDANAMRRLLHDERVRRPEDPADTFIFNYSNVPEGLEAMKHSAIGRSILPYPTYGYKLTRLYGRYAGSVGRVMTGSTKKEDLAMAITALMLFGGLAALIYSQLDDEDTAPVRASGEDFPGAFDRRNRVPLWSDDKAASDRYLRVTKYPFVAPADAIAEAAIAIADKKGPVAAARPGLDIVRDFVTLGPLAQASDAMRGVADEYNRYTPRSAQVGKLLGSFSPFFRVQQDIRKQLDDTVRTPRTLAEGFHATGTFFGDAGKPARTREGRVRRYDQDIELLKSLTGINIKLIAPADATRARRAAERAEHRRKNKQRRRR